MMTMARQQRMLQRVTQITDRRNAAPPPLPPLVPVASLPRAEEVELGERSARVRLEPESGDPLVDKVMRNHLKALAAQNDDVLPLGLTRLPTKDCVIYEPEFEAQMQRSLLARRPPDDDRAEKKASSKKSYLIKSQRHRPAEKPEEPPAEEPYAKETICNAVKMNARVHQIGRAARRVSWFSRHAPHFSLSAVPILLGVKLRRRARQRSEVEAKRRQAISFAVARMTRTSLQEGTRVPRTPEQRKKPPRDSSGLLTSSSDQWARDQPASSYPPMQGGMAFATRRVRSKKHVEKRLLVLQHDLEHNLKRIE